MDIGAEGEQATTSQLQMTESRYGSQHLFPLCDDFGVQPNSNFGGGEQSLEVLLNASEPVIPQPPRAVAINTGGNDEQTNQGKRKRSHRHTTQQINHMESVFKTCPNPDEEQRKELGRLVGLDQSQIKFWFQNKRNQVKAQNEREDNAQLRLENEKLRIKLLKYENGLAQVCCRKCGCQVFDATFISSFLGEDDAANFQCHRGGGMNLPPPPTTLIRNPARPSTSELALPPSPLGGVQIINSHDRFPSLPQSSGSVIGCRPGQGNPAIGSSTGAGMLMPPPLVPAYRYGCTSAAGARPSRMPPPAYLCGNPSSSGAAMPRPQLPARDLHSGSTSAARDAPDEHTATVVSQTFRERRQLVVDMAMSAMDELVEMAQLVEPLWVVDPSSSRVLQLDEAEYASRFVLSAPNQLQPSPGSNNKAQASCGSAIVRMRLSKLLQIFLNVSDWASVFSSIVSKGVREDFLSIGVAGTHDGALQVISADFHVSTPQVTPESHYFLRYCKKNCSNGTWGIVDVSIDRRLGMTPVGRSSRRPSGCLFQETLNGHTKVTWVEHMEAHGGNEAVNIYKRLLCSGMAFGAKRWIEILDCHCERIACMMSLNMPPPTNLAVINPEGKRSIFKLAERMVNGYMNAVSGSIVHPWKVISGTGVGVNDVRVMIRKNINDPGTPSGTILCAATSFWLPLKPKNAFDFLCDERNRLQWDMFSGGGCMAEITSMRYGREIGNSVSLYIGENCSQGNTMILQESTTNSTGSFIIHSSVDMTKMKGVFMGGNPKFVSLLPCGIVILPDGELGDTSSGSLLTISSQILVDPDPTTQLPPESIKSVNQLMTLAVKKVNSFLCGSVSIDNANL